MTSRWNQAAAEPRGKDSSPLAADPISVVTPDTNSYESVCLKHLPLQLSSPTTQHPRLRKNAQPPMTAACHFQLPGPSQPWWGQRICVQLMPFTEMSCICDSWGCLVATVSPKQGPEVLRDQIQTSLHSRDSTAIGPANTKCPHLFL